MDEIYKLLSEIVSDLNNVADNSGIARCILIGKIYGTIKSIERSLRATEESWSKEKVELEEEIRRLSEMLGIRNVEEKE